jgi:hypothetical protein
MPSEIADAQDTAPSTTNADNAKSAPPAASDKAEAEASDSDARPTL